MSGRFLSEDDGARLVCNRCDQTVRSNEAHTCEFEMPGTTFIINMIDEDGSVKEMAEFRVDAEEVMSFLETHDPDQYSIEEYRNGKFVEMLDGTPWLMNHTREVIETRRELK